MSKKEKRVISCHICGDRQKVLKGYLNSQLGLPGALEKVPCPKCTAAKAPSKLRGFAEPPASILSSS